VRIVIPYPDISPVAFTVGPLQVRWYGLMYLVGFVVGYWILRRLAARGDTRFRGELIGDFLGYAALGIVVGGRLGYVLFYNLAHFASQPWEVLAIWHGGLSFHGGFVGVILTGWWFVRRRRLSFYDVADRVMVALPPGLGFGRIGNFINGELFGRPADVPWCMVFPLGGPECRHPSQLYEALLEGLVLFLCMWWIGRGQRPAGVAFWSFVGLYGLLRFLVEFTRLPDPQLGFILGPFTMGQLLSLPMALLGAWMTWRRSTGPTCAPRDGRPARKDGR
jgi:phosphatidylglycerol:prolipoprotein diacylglycerol transferase